MSELIQFFVPGIPAPGGSKKAFAIRRGGVFTGQVVVTEAAGKKNKDWRANVAWCGREAMVRAGAQPFSNMALQIDLTFCMPRPKAHFTSKGILRPDAPYFHTIKPDLTKLTRSTEDALTGIVWTDDSIIATQVLSKHYDDPGCFVSVRERVRAGT